MSDEVLNFISGRRSSFPPEYKHKARPLSDLAKLVEDERYSMSLEQQTPLHFLTAESVFYWFCTTRQFGRILKGELENKSGLSYRSPNENAEIALFRQISFIHTARVAQEPNIILSPQNTYKYFTEIHPNRQHPRTSWPYGLKVDISQTRGPILATIRYNNTIFPTVHSLQKEEDFLKKLKQDSFLFSAEATTNHYFTLDASLHKQNKDSSSVVLRLPFDKPAFHVFSQFIFRQVMKGSTQEQIVNAYYPIYQESNAKK